MTMRVRRCLALNTRNCSLAECLTRFELHVRWATLTCSLVRRNLKLTSQDFTEPERLQRAHRSIRMPPSLQLWMTPRACSVSTPPIYLVTQAQASRNRRKVSREPPCSAQSQRKTSLLTANELLRTCQVVLAKPRQALSYLGRMGSKSTLPSMHTKAA
jgi:hypothetical protein